jgi:hypothetical protein
VPYRVPVRYNSSLLSTQTRTPDIVDSLFLKINHENKTPETEVTELKLQYEKHFR